MSTTTTQRPVEAGTPRDAELALHPERIWFLSPTEMYGIPLADVVEIQRRALGYRLEELRARIPMVARLAENQQISSIGSIPDMAPMLFQHSVYKAYPLSLLETGKFDRLTQWLDKLTTYDLSAVDMTGVDTIDDWLDALDAQTPIRVRHSSGTSGKLSFIPGGPTDYATGVRSWMKFFQGFGTEPDADNGGFEDVPVIFPSYRSGAMHQHRLLDEIVQRLFNGNQSMIVTLYPGRMSADALSLGGRIAAAEARGESGLFQLSPKLLARREEFLKMRLNNAQAVSAFFSTIAERFRGRRISLLGSVAQIFDVAEAGLRSGLRDVFTTDSMIMMGGGMKGRQLPADWNQTILSFLGVPQVRQGYGMTELVGATRACPAGHFHLPPPYVPFILDAETGEQRPRTGEQSGRLGVYDLTRKEMWGGFLTGDAVTLRWGDVNPCACGRIGPHLLDSVRRYGSAEGGDDKVTCAGAPAAHDKALDFLASL